MKIGIFDSGLGGLLIAKTLAKELPEYDYLYLGDTANLPYGNKSQAEIYSLTQKGLTYLLAADCKLVIVACNTASAKALRKIQRQYLPASWPDRKVLGVIIPTVEETLAQPNVHRIGILATKSTVESEAFIREIKKLSPEAIITQQAAPRLVTAIESKANDRIDSLLNRYLKPLQAANIDTLILGCTHYGLIKDRIAQFFTQPIRLISADMVVTQKLVTYLQRHDEVKSQLSRGNSLKIVTTC